MSIQGPGILFRWRAGGGLITPTFTRAGSAIYLSNSGILNTAATNVLRTTWFDTNNDGILDAPAMWIEINATNLALWSRDLSNAAWVKTNATAAKTQIGVDGASNSASLVTATAGNGTVLQSITSASATRAFSAFVKRVSGTGVVNMTMDNGSTWTAISVTNRYQRFTIPTQLLTNPTCGFRLVTNGDAIAVDYTQLETTAIGAMTSPILTTSASASRATDNLNAAFSYGPRSMTIYAKYIAEHISGGVDAVIAAVGSGNPFVAILSAGTTGVAKVQNVNLAGANVSATIGSAPTLGQVVEIRGVINVDGSVLVGQSIANASETVSAASGAQTLEAAWTSSVVTIGSAGGSSPHSMGLMNLLILNGVRTLVQCRGLV